jgi:3-methyl-2-oxobutanoate hydroxymethyltransferase
VFHDLVGGFPWFIPSFVQPKANIAADIIRGVTEWKNELQTPQA